MRCGHSGRCPNCRLRPKKTKHACSTSRHYDDLPISYKQIKEEVESLKKLEQSESVKASILALEWCLGNECPPTYSPMAIKNGDILSAGLNHFSRLVIFDAGPLPRAPSVFNTHWYSRTDGLAYIKIARPTPKSNPFAMTTRLSLRSGDKFTFSNGDGLFVTEDISGGFLCYGETNFATHALEKSAYGVSGDFLVDSWRDHIHVKPTSKDFDCTTVARQLIRENKCVVLDSALDAEGRAIFR